VKEHDGRWWRIATRTVFGQQIAEEDPDKDDNERLFHLDGPCPFESERKEKENDGEAGKIVDDCLFT